METMKRLIISGVLAGALSFALEPDHEREINRLIEEVKNAPPEEKYKVMNELKMRLREIRGEEREEMIKEVYERLKGREYEHHGEREFGKEEHGVGEEKEEHMGDDVYEKVENKKEESEGKGHEHRHDEDDDDMMKPMDRF